MTTATLGATAPTLVESTASPVIVPVTVARSHLLSIHRLGTIAITSLPIGVLLAILTTSDPDWWHLHFSQLGTFGNLSSKLFNSTVLVSGFFLAAYGVLVSVALPSHTGRRTSRFFRGSIVSAGLHLTIIGMIPIPVSPVLHDIAASGLGLSFLAVVASSLGIRGRGRGFRRYTIFCVTTLAAGMVVLTAGFITLALFELVAFSLMLVWLGVLPRALAVCAPAPAVGVVDADVPTRELSAPREPDRVRCTVAEVSRGPVTAQRLRRPVGVSGRRDPRRAVPARRTRPTGLRLSAPQHAAPRPMSPRRRERPIQRRPLPRARRLTRP